MARKLPEAGDGSQPLRMARMEAYAAGVARGLRQVEAYRAAGYAAKKAVDASASNIAARADFRARVIYLKAQLAAERAESRTTPDDWEGFVALWHDLIRDLEELVDLCLATGNDASAVRALITSLAGKMITSEETLAAADRYSPRERAGFDHLRVGARHELR